MRFPRASAVIVALSTFVAVATVAALVSQLSPTERAGAVLPEGAITTTSQPVDIVEETETPAPGDPTQESSDSGSGTGGPGTNDQGSTSEGTTVVAPAPAEPVTPETGPPATPGSSGSAPGLSGSPGNSDDAPGQSKP